MTTMIMRVQRAIGGDFAHRGNFRCEVNRAASRYVVLHRDTW
jgi:hypothetical protein